MQVLPPTALPSTDMLALAHTPAYYQAFLEGELAPDIERRIGLSNALKTPALINRTLWEVAGAVSFFLPCAHADIFQLLAPLCEMQQMHLTSAQTQQRRAWPAFLSSLHARHSVQSDMAIRAALQRSMCRAWLTQLYLAVMQAHCWQRSLHLSMASHAAQQAERTTQRPPAALASASSMTWPSLPSCCCGRAPELTGCWCWTWMCIKVCLDSRTELCRLTSLMPYCCDSHVCKELPSLCTVNLRTAQAQEIRTAHWRKTPESTLCCRRWDSSLPSRRAQCLHVQLPR